MIKLIKKDIEKTKNLVEDPPADTVPDQGRRPEKIISIAILIYL